MSPELYRMMVRPLLFRLPPETAQKVAELALKRAWRAFGSGQGVLDARLRSELCGLTLRNPVGQAAGFDKDCALVRPLAALGFGYLTVGTVTEQPRPGNPRPRLLRYAKQESLVNAMGFPNKGLEHAARRLELARRRPLGAPLVVSVSGTTADEIVRCHRRLEPLADAVEINVSSPNTAGLRAFHEVAALADLLARVNDGRRKPLLVKLPPYPSPGPAEAGHRDDRNTVLAMLSPCLEAGVDALTVANSRPVKDSRLAVGAGGLSGRPVFGDTLRMVAEVRAEVGAKAAINACGGIFTGEDAWQALKAGATTVQLYTGLVYRGPGVVKRISRELLASMAGEHVDSLSRVASEP